MSASGKRIRQHWKVKPTAQDKGLKLTVTVVAYDNGLVEVDGVLVDDSAAPDPGKGWLVAAERLTSTLVEFRKDAVKRQEKKGKGGGGTHRGRPARRAAQPQRPRPEPAHHPYDSSGSGEG